MGCDTCAKLIGAVPESEIANFLATRYNCKASYLNIEASSYGKKYELVGVKEDYDTGDEWIVVSGFIRAQSINQNLDRAVFYYRTNVNFHENLEYYEEKGLGEMVRARTTNVSLHSDQEGISIIKAIAEEFGGWFTENDCDDEYERIYGRREGVCAPIRERRIDLIVNVETMTGQYNSPISRISATKANIETGVIYEVFDKRSGYAYGEGQLLQDFIKWVKDATNDITKMEDNENE